MTSGKERDSLEEREAFGDESELRVAFLPVSNDYIWWSGYKNVAQNIATLYF